jgi:hypothetical protein
MYICNVAGQPGETMGYSVLNHLDVIRHFAGGACMDAVIANSKIAEESRNLGLITPCTGWDDDAVYVAADVIDDNRPTHHDPLKLAAVIGETYQKHRGKRRRLPRLRRKLDLPSLTPNGSGPDTTQRRNGAKAQGSKNV